MASAVDARAQVLLKLGEGWSLSEVCRAFDVCRNTATHVRTRSEEGVVDAVLRDERKTRYRQALMGRSRPTSWPSPVARFPTATTTGRCAR